jgi:hypothetical protein
MFQAVVIMNKEQTFFRSIKAFAPGKGKSEACYSINGRSSQQETIKQTNNGSQKRRIEQSNSSTRLHQQDDAAGQQWESNKSTVLKGPCSLDKKWHQAMDKKGSNSETLKAEA